MVYDVLRRVLEARGLEVTHIQNVTDVDDKIINRAAETGVSAQELAERFAAEAAVETRALGLLAAHAYPRVTEHITPIVDMVQTLETKGYAYARGGDVYFDVSKDADYGKLSGQKPEELESGARIESHKAAILAALRIAGELFEERSQSETLAADIAALSDEIRPWLPPAKRNS